MTPGDALARRRWLAIVAARLAGTVGAVFGLIVAARAPGWPDRLLGIAIILSALAMMAVVPLHLAARWRSPE